ncbi:hypothetical protein [Sphingobium chungbukense]|uniref:Arc-like DNA binding domain-containing protein n=1 Tax=Sphingobium chungbukense TaxID=56193 RepID=A0A0M3AS34_9SPHN|nr:hypothetical protein [Sphingobium chungbukense]KKW92693.1 hypothetical protein YP76_07105 [Sphingobium chungbukense]
MEYCCESEKRIAPFGLRLPPDLKQRVIEAASQSKTSVNALITSVLEREFPQPTINAHELAAFLSGLVTQTYESDGGAEYFAEVNRALASAKTPWCVKCVDDVVSFYPYADSAPE